jgi:intracellular sulfur oxidation DsrE/DsrF family protein
MSTVEAIVCMHMKALKPLVLLFSLFIVAVPLPGLAASVDELLAGKEAPYGVVFEIVSGDEDLLRELLPVVKRDIERLRERFPKLPIAIVSHGNEQFALTTGNQQREPALQDLASELVTGQEVSLHVCNAYASMFGIAAEDFPDYVNVSAHGPEQIKDYRALDYRVITLP